MECDVHYAKTNLSKLLKQAESGEEVIIHPKRPAVPTPGGGGDQTDTQIWNAAGQGRAGKGIAAFRDA
jgi:hypothetical protein